MNLLVHYHMFLLYINYSHYPNSIINHFQNLNNFLIINMIHIYLIIPYNLYHYYLLYILIYIIYIQCHYYMNLFQVLLNNYNHHILIHSMHILNLLHLFNIILQIYMMNNQPIINIHLMQQDFHFHQLLLLLYILIKY